MDYEAGLLELSSNYKIGRFVSQQPLDGAETHASSLPINSDKLYALVPGGLSKACSIYHSTSITAMTSLFVPVQKRLVQKESESFPGDGRQNGL